MIDTLAIEEVTKRDEALGNLLSEIRREIASLRQPAPAAAPAAPSGLGDFETVAQAAASLGGLMDRGNLPAAIPYQDRDETITGQSAGWLFTTNPVNLAADLKLVFDDAGGDTYQRYVSATSDWQLWVDGAQILGATSSAFTITVGAATFSGSLIVSSNLDVGGYLNVGTVADAVAQGDFAAGLTGAARMVWDQSAPSLTLRSAANADVFTLNVATRTFRIEDSGGTPVNFHTPAARDLTVDGVSGSDFWWRWKNTSTGAFHLWVDEGDLWLKKGTLYVEEPGEGMRFKAFPASVLAWTLAGDTATRDVIMSAGTSANVFFQFKNTSSGRAGFKVPDGDVQLDSGKLDLNGTGSSKGIDIASALTGWTLYGDSSTGDLHLRKFSSTTRAFILDGSAGDARLDVLGLARIGDSTAAAARGDFSAGSATEYVFWDESAETWSQYSGGSLINRLSSVPGTETVFNEQGEDIDTRIEGDAVQDVLFVDAAKDLLRVGGSFSVGAAPWALTISGGDSVTPDGQVRVVLAAASGTADDLVTIVATNYEDGAILVLAADTGDTITLKHGIAGGSRLRLSGSVDYALSGDKNCTVMYDATNTHWVEIARGDI